MKALSSGHKIETLETIRALYKSSGTRIRIRFRGPRYDAMACHCLKKDARTFAVYPR
jgi:hypothetical protein